MRYIVSFYEQGSVHILAIIKIIFGQILRKVLEAMERKYGLKCLVLTPRYETFDSE